MVEKGLARTEPTTSRVSFYDVIIRPFRFFYTKGGVPVSLLQTGSVSATPLQTDGISNTPVQSGRVSAVTRMNDVIGFSLRKSTFYSSLYTMKIFQSTYPKAYFTSNPNNFKPESKNITTNSNNSLCHPGLGLIESLRLRHNQS